MCVCTCVCGCQVYTTTFTQLLPEKSPGQAVEMMLESGKKVAGRLYAKVIKSK